MTALFSFAFGSALFVLAMHFIDRSSRITKRKLREQWDNSTGEELYLKSAGIVRDMWPLIQNLNLHAAKITIIAGDGSYIISPNSKMLKTAISGWIRSGASITYVLLSPSEEVLRKFEELIAWLAHQGHENAFQLEVFQESSCDEKARDLFSRFQTHHPTLIETKEGDALWLEGFHDKNSMFAYNVRFIPPSAVSVHTEKAELVENYKREVELVRSSCH